MKKLVFGFIFLLVFHLSRAQTVPETIDELLKVYSKQFAFNGNVLVAQHDSIIFEKGYGFRDLASHQTNDRNTIFQVGSITKQFTAAIILQLRQKNLLRLDDALSKYIPGYPNGDQITIEQLLTHTSGVYNYTADENFMRSRASVPIALDSLIGLFKNKPLDFKPGTKYNYSNSGYVLLGYIIEKLTGKTYFAVVREQILEPLHMKHSGFDFKGLKSSDKATGYLKLTATRSQLASIVDSTVSYAAGAMYSCLEDMYAWDRSLYTNAIIDSVSIRDAFTPHLANYGYGWVIDTVYGKKVVMHEGGTFGFVSFIGRIPDDKTCIILFDNHSGIGMVKIAEDINAIMNNQPYDFPKYRKEIELDEATLRQYEGVYQFGPHFLISIKINDGHLTAQANGQGQNDFYAEKKDYFFAKIVETQMQFIRDGDGKVTRLTIYQGGQEVQGKKIK